MDELAQVVAEVLKMPNILGSVQRISDPMVARAVGVGLQTTTGLLSGDDTGQLRQATRYDVASPNFGKEHAQMKPEGVPVATFCHDETPKSRFFCSWRDCGSRLTSDSPGYCSAECQRRAQAAEQGSFGPSRSTSRGRSPSRVRPSRPRLRRVAPVEVCLTKPSSPVITEKTCMN